MKLLNRLLYLKSTKIGRQILKPFQKWYLILRYNIVSTRTLCILSVQFSPTVVFTYILPKCTNNFILSARVRGPLRPVHTETIVKGLS